MNKRELRRGVEDALLLWRPITGLDHWTIERKWAAVPEREDAPAAFVATPEYLTGTIYLNMPLLLHSEFAKSQRHLSYLVLHELCHGLNWEIVEQVEELARAEPMRKSMERCTCMIARALWVAKYGQEPPE